MPDFNTFRINENLLGEVLVARSNVDLSATQEEKDEVKTFMQELEEEKRKRSKSLKVKLMELFTNKTFINFSDSNGNNAIREYEVKEKVEKNVIKLSTSTNRPIEFEDDLNRWKQYIHEENKNKEILDLVKAEQEKVRQQLVNVFGETIQQKMMKLI